ncbi:MAG: hypothetical protein ACLS89_04540 [Collinsella sp.]
MNPTRRRRRHLSSEEREDAFRAAAAREAGAAPKGGSAPTRLPTRRQVTWRGGARAASAPSPFLGRAAEASVPSVADQVSDGEVKVTRRRPGDGGERLPRLRMAPLERRAARDRGGEGSADQGQSAVAVAVPASRARMVARARPRLRPHHNRPPANNARERI